MISHDEESLHLQESDFDNDFVMKKIYTNMMLSWMY